MGFRWRVPFVRRASLRAEKRSLLRSRANSSAKHVSNFREGCQADGPAFSVCASASPRAEGRSRFRRRLQTAQGDVFATGLIVSRDRWRLRRFRHRVPVSGPARQGPRSFASLRMTGGEAERCRSGSARFDDPGHRPRVRRDGCSMFRVRSSYYTKCNFDDFAQEAIFFRPPRHVFRVRDEKIDRHVNPTGALSCRAHTRSTIRPVVSRYARGELA